MRREFDVFTVDFWRNVASANSFLKLNSDRDILTSG